LLITDDGQQSLRDRIAAELLRQDAAPTAIPAPAPDIRIPVLRGRKRSAAATSPQQISLF